MQQLVQEIRNKKSFLCIGLDTDLNKIPPHLLKEENPVLAFNKAIIDATKEVCVCYKINTAFYEAQGVKGWQTMQDTLAYIPQNIFTIADAKRGDIGNTGEQYAKAFFETLNFDSITVAPYMGKDSVLPFLHYENKFAIVLALTSNEGAYDFQFLPTGEKKMYEQVLTTISGWGTPNNLMFVVGATKAAELEHIRQIVPDNFLLVPGVGTQGGSLQEVFRYGANANIGLLVNISRGIIYAGLGEDFAQQAAQAAYSYQQEMAVLLSNFKA